MQKFIFLTKLQNEGFAFYNSKLTDIPKSYIIRLNHSSKLVSKTLKWRKKEIYQAYYRDLNLIVNYDALRQEYFLCNTKLLKF